MDEASESLQTGLGLIKLVSDWQVYAKINMQRKRIKLGIICCIFFVISVRAALGNIHLNLFQ